jgi:hypothetical protein
LGHKKLSRALLAASNNKVVVFCSIKYSSRTSIGKHIASERIRTDSHGFIEVCHLDKQNHGNVTFDTDHSQKAARNPDSQAVATISHDLMCCLSSLELTGAIV